MSSRFCCDRLDQRLLFLIYDRYFLAGYRRFRYLWTSEHSASCGVKLQIGKTYLIGVKYNYQRNRFELNLCSSLYRILHHWRHRKWHIYSRMRQCLRYDAFKEYLKPRSFLTILK
ncbi:hypothetical protein SSS_07876 [Sarcoptes scabiei]|nr:hypothetical protein SSS_07876 [Sarcoptes scabiei]